jgi:hypothetical protein
VGRDDSARLRRLEEILAGPLAGDERGERAGRSVEATTLDRVRRLTAELQARGGAPVDEIDALASRLLLADYAAAVSRLRSVAREAGRSIDAASESVREVRRFLWRRDKLRDDLSPSGDA